MCACVSEVRPTLSLWRFGGYVPVNSVCGGLLDLQCSTDHKADRVFGEKWAPTELITNSRVKLKGAGGGRGGGLPRKFVKANSDLIKHSDETTRNEPH